MANNSPYRVQVMRISDLKEAEDDTSALQAASDSVSDTQPTQSVREPVGSAKQDFETTPQEAATVPDVSSAQQVSPHAQLPPTPVPVPEATTLKPHAVEESDSETLAQEEIPEPRILNEVVIQPVPVEGSVEKRTSEYADTGETLPPDPRAIMERMHPAEPIDDDISVLRVSPRYDSSVPSAPVPLDQLFDAVDAHIETPARTPTTPSTKLSEKPLAPKQEGVNLSALRERVLHDSTSQEFQGAAKAQAEEEEVRARALQRKAQLAGTDIHALHAAHASVADDEQHVDPTTAPTEQQPAQEVEPLHIVPQTTHAAEIARVAENLRKLNAGETISDEAAPAKQAVGAHKANLAVVRTFRGDVEQTMRHEQTSVVSALSAEEKRRGVTTAPIVGNRASTVGPGAYLLIGVSVLLLLFGGIGVAVYYFTSSTSSTVSENDTPAIISVEKTEEFNVTGRTRADIMNRLLIVKDQANIRIGAITEVRMVEDQSLVGQKKVIPVTGQNFLKYIDARVPQPLVRSLSNEMLFGIHEWDGNQPILIFKTGFYENAFAGMLEWERSINLDLTPLFGAVVDLGSAPQIQPSSEVDETATTSATSTPPVVPGSDTRGFKDAIIENKEVRLLRNDEGKVVLLWAFPDTSTIVITTNIDSFVEVVKRMSARRY